MRCDLTRAAKIAAFLAVLCAGGGAGLSACTSPTEDALIEALGPEADGESEDEFHRYGQPCLACHGGYGPAEPVFSFAGTVFARPGDEVPVSGAKVTITDATGEKTTMKSNCAGNFFVDASKYEPVFPVRVEVVCSPPPGFDGVQKTYRNVMGTRVNRDGSCASCHDNTPASQTSPGRIYCVEDGISTSYALDPDCKGGPKVGSTSTAGSAGASTGGGP